MLLGRQVATVQPASIVVISENIDGDLDRVVDDRELIDWLVAEGHFVDVRRNTWEDSDTRGSLTTAQGELNRTAAGLRMLRNAITYVLSSPTL